MTVTIRDRFGATRSKQFTFVVAPTPTINGPDGLVEWTRGRDYPGTQVTATGGVTPFVWSASNLPPGLTIDRDTGVISGAANAQGTFNVTVRLVDAAGGTAERAYTLVIHAVPQVTTNALPDGEVTVPYNATANATAGTPPYVWAASGLPQGLTIDANTGAISGTPAAAGTFQVTLTAVDTAGAAASRIIPLTIDLAPSIGGPADLNDWTVDMAYAPTPIQPDGGLAPYTFAATGLPPGMFVNQNTGNIAGTPTATGNYDVTIFITDARGATNQRPYNMTINPPPTINGPANMPDGAVGGIYPEATFTAANGTPPRSFDATGLPPGLEIDSGSGVVSGTPTQAGDWDVDVTVTDAAGATATMRSTITINPPPTLATIVPAVAVQGVPLPVVITGTNFAPAATISFAPAANAPAVANLVVAPNVITVTITANAPGTYDVIVTNPDGGRATLANALTVT